MQIPKLSMRFILRCGPHALCTMLLFCAAFSVAEAQTGDVLLKPYNNTDEQKLYNFDTTMHTAWKPVLYTDSLLPIINEPWFKRKFFQEHLVQVQTPGFNLYGDIIVDEYIGKSGRYNKKVGALDINSTMPGMNTRGVELSGNIGNKVYFETNFYENQGKYGGYIDSFAREYNVLPGIGPWKPYGTTGGFDFSTSTGRIIYMPSKHFLLDLGNSKNFIGDGYRSLLLSQNSTIYPYFRVAATFGKFQYSVMWSQYIDTVDVKQNNNLGYLRKWGQTYFIDWSPTKAFSLGLFESVIWPGQIDNDRTKTDLSPWLLSPVIFAHGRTTPSGVRNFDMLGLNSKLWFFDRSYFYGQLVVNQLGAFSSAQNRTGYQLGVRSGDIFEIPGLNVLAEFNTVRPYTYAGASSDVNYSNANQALAHPLGANFAEGLAVVTYAYNRWRFRFEGFVANYGADTGQANYGQNILAHLPIKSPSGDVKQGQGVAATIDYADLKLSYILNPKTNLRLETGFTYRHESSSVFDYQDKIFYIGIRMTFRSLQYDF